MITGRSSVSMRASALARDGYTEKALLRTRKRIRNLERHKLSNKKWTDKKELKLNALKEREKNLGGVADV